MSNVRMVEHMALSKYKGVHGIILYSKEIYTYLTQRFVMNFVCCQHVFEILLYNEEDLRYEEYRSDKIKCTTRIFY